MINVMGVRALEALFVGPTIRLRTFDFCPRTAKTDHTLPVPTLGAKYTTVISLDQLANLHSVALR